MAAAFAPTRQASVVFTWLVLGLFLILLITGWKYLIEPSVGDAFLATLAATILAAIAFLAARQIAQYRAQAMAENAAAPWYTGWRPYILLALLSSIGTINAAFVLFESRAIIRQDISVVRGNYDKLLSDAKARLPPPGYMSKLNQLDGLLKSLHEEIVNPNKGNYCGVGTAATSIIGKISTLIPQYTVIRGSGLIKPCDERAQRLYQSYETMAHDMLKHDKDFASSRGNERLEFADELKRHYDKVVADLSDLESRASGFGGVASLPLSQLYEARRQYNSDRQKYIGLIEDARPGIDEIDTLQSEQTGYAATLQLLMRRFQHFNTWVYVGVAFGIDFALIYFLTLLYIDFVASRATANQDSRDFPEKFNVDPKFIWVRPKRLSR